MFDPQTDVIIYGFSVQLREAALGLIKSVREVHTAISKNAGEEGLVNTACMTAAEDSTKILNMVLQHKGKIPDAALEMLIEQAQNVDKFVQEVVQKAKIASANPYDFMTKQNLEEACKTVSEGVQKLVRTTRQLANTGSTTEESSAPKVQLDMSLIKKMAAALRSLEDDCRSSNKEKLNVDIKAVTQGCNTLVQTLKQLNQLALADELRDRTVQVVSSAKVAFNKPTQVYLEQLGESLKREADTLKALVQTTSRKKSEGENENASTPPSSSGPNTPTPPITVARTLPHTPSKLGLSPLLSKDSSNSLGGTPSSPKVPSLPIEDNLPKSTPTSPRAGIISAQTPAKVSVTRAFCSTNGGQSGSLTEREEDKSEVLMGNTTERVHKRSFLKGVPLTRSSPSTSSAVRMVRSSSFKDPLDESDYLELTRGVLDAWKLSAEDDKTLDLAAQLKALLHKQLQSRKDSRMNKLSAHQLNSLQGNEC